MSAGLKPVEITPVDDLPVYPISVEDRLDSHYFLQWNLKRWRGSDLRKKAYSDPEVGFYAFELFFAAQDETPVGTLPCNSESLAFLVRLPLEKWNALCGRELSPLHGWSRVRCDNGEIRYAHPVVTEVACEALSSNQRNNAKTADERLRKRFGTIRKNLALIPSAAPHANDNLLVEKVNKWITDNYPGGNAGIPRVREAWEALSKVV